MRRNRNLREDHCTLIVAICALVAIPAAGQKRVCSSVPPCTQMTIQAAIDEASSGETILVEPGVYMEALAGQQRSRITLRSTTPYDPSAVIVDADGAGSVVEAGVGWTIEGLTLRNGSAARGGGIYVVSGGVAGITVRSCVIEDNEASINGGGLDIGSGRLVVVDSVFRNNTAGTPSDDGRGGGLRSDAVDVTIVNSTFENNHAFGSGGGIYAANGSGKIQILGSVVSGNSSSEFVTSGGGIFSGVADTVIAGTLISGNEAGAINGSSQGGGRRRGRTPRGAASRRSTAYR